ncbi:AGE family epimerase/isomerase [uncultured Draconibacterium sp.]|uniref:AGE family epimerase/isomerase n=1 Tax=uncultured Draconibacterium sp. TaxID=1573823 RepID=UPI0025E45B2D|nr:AGE family epimerase/isomerase [uncultured Draconibacterium sp.]
MTTKSVIRIQAAVIKFLTYLTGILYLQFIAIGCSTPSSEIKTTSLVSETTNNLTENILPFWENYTPDPNGGFYGTVLNDGTPIPEAPKGCVLNARILWTFSNAYMHFENEAYLELANRAQEYFLAHFIDEEFGGTYWVVQADGTPLDDQKQCYGIAFAIYGLGAHYQATGNHESLQQAISLYHTLEEKAFDPLNGGYIESFTRDWKTPKRYGYDGTGVAAKTMNTHLHLLEAYSQLYKVWPDSGLKSQLRGLVDVFLEKIIDQKRWHQNLFLTREWENLEQIDSYGHDVELSWLLTEATELIQEETLIKQTKDIALKLVDTQMQEGRNPDGSLLYERRNGEIEGNLSWWPQAESVIAFFNAWQISGDEKYLDAAITTWEWIKNNLVDTEYGGWYGGLESDEQPIIGQPKVSLWKCPYHNSRMAFELLVRTQKPN